MARFSTLSLSKTEVFRRKVRPVGIRLKRFIRPIRFGTEPFARLDKKKQKDTDGLQDKFGEG